MTTTGTKAILACMVAGLIAGCASQADRSYRGTGESLVFEHLDTPACKGKAWDFSQSLEAVRAALKDGPGDDEMLDHYRSLSCVSARDFKDAYFSLMGQVPEQGDRSSDAPLVFLYFDMGARLIDDRALRWLQAWRDDLDAGGESVSTRFLAARGENLQRVSKNQQAGLLMSLRGSTWSGRCSFRNMSWTPGGQPYCKEDTICPALRQYLGDDTLSISNDQDWNELCEKMCRAVSTNAPQAQIDPRFSDLCAADHAGSLEIPKPDRAGILACLETWLESTQRDNSTLVCVDWSRPDPLDLPGTKPVAAVEIDERCMLANNVPPSTRDPEKELEAAKERLKELKDKEIDTIVAYNFYVVEHEEPEQDTPEYFDYHSDIRKFEDDLEWLKQQIEKTDQEIQDLENEIERKKRYGTLGRCNPDDLSCADNCSIQDQQHQAFLECLSRTSGQPDSPLPDPVDPEDEPGSDPFPAPDPDVTDPPDDAPHPDAAFAELTECIDDVLSDETDECSQRLRCADGSVPVKNDMGHCACPGGFFGLPGELPCETLIDCPAEGPCECEGAPLGTADPPGGTDGPVLIIRP